MFSVRIIFSEVSVYVDLQILDKAGFVDKWSSMHYFLVETSGGHSDIIHLIMWGNALLMNIQICQMFKKENGALTSKKQLLKIITWYYSKQWKRVFVNIPHYFSCCSSKVNTCIVYSQKSHFAYCEVLILYGTCHRIQQVGEGVDMFSPTLWMLRGLPPHVLLEPHCK